jgi:hypothetical protein
VPWLLSELHQLAPFLRCGLFFRTICFSAPSFVYQWYGTFTLTHRSSLTAQAGIYTIEFHIPYLALREGPPIQDPRRLGSGNYPRHELLPLPRPIDKEAYYYEAQTSFLLTGIDERMYSAICFDDTFFEKEHSFESYVDKTSPLDAPSGGSIWLQYPVWNPRQYVLAVQSHRIFQATEEWTALINCFVERLQFYVRHLLIRP